MKPITTYEELSALEAIFRNSERARIAAFIRSCREERPVVQVFDVLADKIAKGEHWNES